MILISGHGKYLPMTRINVGIDPSELCDKHLVAEYRERLSTARTAPRWTRRDPPAWARPEPEPEPGSFAEAYNRSLEEWLDEEAH